ncbi:MAG TPA: hypothetical protein VFS60_09960, partial [Thermoanaerobaculia bacterium]|nr:hypothetical protein [Thermoanaerobaculia bacterium]
SEAAGAYERLSGHEYHRIGKRFPPYLGERAPQPTDIAEWRAFIDTFPWFPATDDAYYRLAHACFMAGEFDQAAAVIDEFGQRVFVDRDVESYMAALATIVQAARRPPSPESASRTARVVQEVDWLRYEDNANVMAVEKAVLAVDWLIANQPTADELGLDRGFLESLRLSLDAERRRCRETWFEKCAVPAAVELVRERAEGGVDTDGGFTEAFLHSLLGGEP